MIQTRRLILEPVAPDHAGPMFDGLRDQSAYRFLPDDPPATIGDLRARYDKWAVGMSPDGAEIWLNWMVRRRDGGDYVGFVQATIFRAERTALIAYHIFPPVWRRGFGAEAVAAMLADIAARHQLTQAQACIDTRNEASIGLIESLGFVLTDTIANADCFRGERSDEYFYTKRLGP